ncbi:MAG: hypothetical protein JXP37_09850 [Coriobacteriia bacterium]|nr:hypothetical protein [Coriobacteriia bacterium]
MKKAVLLGALAAVMLFGIVGLAVADTVVYEGTGVANSPQSTSGTVNVAASVNSKITLTIATVDGGAGELLVDFGAVDPETDYDEDIDLTVKSNRLWDLSVTKSASAADIGLETTYQDGLEDQVRGTTLLTDNYAINVPYETAAGDYTATVQYTVTQQ